jgi:hypothetical protein
MPGKLDAYHRILYGGHPKQDHHHEVHKAAHHDRHEARHDRHEARHDRHEAQHDRHEAQHDRQNAHQGGKSDDKEGLQKRLVGTNPGTYSPPPKHDDDTMSPHDDEASRSCNIDTQIVFDRS